MAYDAFAAEHGRRHDSLAEYEHRRRAVQFRVLGLRLYCWSGCMVWLFEDVGHPAARSAEGGDEAYDAFAAEHGRRHTSLAEYEHRARVFAGSAALVAAHNAAPGRGFTLALNGFADWTQVLPLRSGCPVSGCGTPAGN